MRIFTLHTLSDCDYEYGRRLHCNAPPSVPVVSRRKHARVRLDDGSQAEPAENGATSRLIVFGAAPSSFRLLW